MSRMLSFAAALASTTAPATAAIKLPPGFEQAQVASGITGATAIEIAPDGRVFVCEQTGALRVVKGDVLLPRPFVTLKVDSQWERGLLGVALDPAFPKNGYVYVTNIVENDKPNGTRISRFEAKGDTPKADPKSEKVIFEWPSGGHNAGCLKFGPDGYLYVVLNQPDRIERITPADASS